jgi:hypothetical protein
MVVAIQLLRLAKTIGCEGADSGSEPIQDFRVSAGCAAGFTSRRVEEPRANSMTPLPVYIQT